MPLTSRRLTTLVISFSFLPFFSIPTVAQVTIDRRPRPAARVELPDTPLINLRVDSSLALIPAHVTTEQGATVTDLRKENFRLFEEGVEQEITYFAKDDVPVSVGLVFDSSASMHDKKHKVAEAAAAFFRTSGPQDEFFLIQFDERPRLAVPFTLNSDEVYQRVLHAKAFGRTSLLDAVHDALAQMKLARNSRKALVILSDGGDNRSRHTFVQIKNELLESDVQVYAMGVFAADLNKLSPEEADGPHLLDELAWESGGTHFRVDNLQDLPEVSERLGHDLRDQYVLGYSPSNSVRDGKYRRVKLDLVLPDRMPPPRVYYRGGYYAPVQ
jgi:Ca-activated chloride channel family protein